MEVQRNTIIQSAMSFGLFMGLFWVIKYIFYMIGFKFPLVMPVYWGLSMFVPVIAYRMSKMHYEYWNREVGFSHIWRFGVLIYFFAAIIVSLMHYIFYKFVAPEDFITSSITQTLNALKDAQVDPKVLESIKNMHISPINMALQGILNNVFYGIILSIPVAYLVTRKRS